MPDGIIQFGINDTEFSGISFKSRLVQILLQGIQNVLFIGLDGRFQLPEGIHPK